MTLSKPLLVGQLAAQVARAPLALVGVEGAPPISQVSTRSFLPHGCWGAVRQTQQHASERSRAERCPVREPSGATTKVCEFSGLLTVNCAMTSGQVLAAECGALQAASLPEAEPSMLLVGPEGDFTPSELDGLIEAGARPVGLGPNRLRVETAALSMITAVTLWDRG